MNEPVEMGFLTWMREILLGETGGVFALGLMCGGVLIYIFMERFYYRGKIEDLTAKIASMEARLAKYEEFQDELSSEAFKTVLDQIKGRLKE